MQITWLATKKLEQLMFQILFQICLIILKLESPNLLNLGYSAQTVKSVIVTFKVDC